MTRPRTCSHRSPLSLDLSRRCLALERPGAGPRPASAGACLALLFAAHVLVGGPGCQGNDKRLTLPAPNAKAASGPQAVRTVRLAAESTTEIIRATGTTQPLSMTKVMPLVPGLIVKIAVREGDRVRRGQLLLQQDTRGFQLHVQQAQAGVEAATVGTDAMLREKNRFETLAKANAIDQAQFEQIQDRYLGALAGLKQARVGLAMAKKALADATIRSPYDGIVVKKLVSLGDYATSMPPTVAFILMETSRLELHISLPEPDLGRIRAGQTAEATFGATGRVVKGELDRVIPSVDPMTRSFVAVMELDNPDFSIEPGLFAKVRILTGQPRSRLLVQKDLVVDEGSGVYSVFTVEGGVARRQVIRIAEAGGEKTEIIDGVEPGAELILDPSGLADGDPITASPAPAATAPGTAAPSSAPASPVRAEAAK